MSHSHSQAQKCRISGDFFLGRPVGDPDAAKSWPRPAFIFPVEICGEAAEEEEE